MNAVAEPLAELWSTDSGPEPTRPTPAEDDSETLPELHPDPTLARRSPPQAALEAAHQPVTRGQLVARQAELAAADESGGG